MKQDLKAGVINVSPRNWIWSVVLYLRFYCCCCLFSLLACTGFWVLILILIHVGMACSLLFAKGPMTAYAHIQLQWKHSSPVLKQWGWFSQEFVNIGPITLESILECASMHGWNPWDVSMREKVDTHPSGKISGPKSVLGRAKYFTIILLPHPQCPWCTTKNQKLK